MVYIFLGLVPPLYIELPMKPLVNFEVPRFILWRQVPVAYHKIDKDFEIRK
jgi:hypothetical protein